MRASFCIPIGSLMVSFASSVGTSPSSTLALDSTPAVTASIGPSSTIIGTPKWKVPGVEAFNGIPYAEPPLGPLRLRPPKKLSPPAGVFDATKPAITCPQFRGSPVVFTDAFTQLISSAVNQTFFYAPIPSSEDCLTLNVIRPSGTEADAKLPVVFWIHGGGFQVGSAAQYDGSAFVAKSVEFGKPVIYVALNYRLAGFGFMPGKEVLADGAANLGLLDQRMALEWVASHIAAFGGDPAKVTIWGESAGSLSVFNQMGLFGGNHTSLNSNRTLFRGAILNSGSLFMADPVDCPKGQAVFDAVVDKAGCGGREEPLACLRGLDFATFEEATNAVPGFMSANSISLSYLPRPDGKVLTDSAEVLVQEGKYAAVPLIVGGQEDEGTLFSFFQTNISDTPAVVDYLSTLYFHGASREDLRTLVGFYDESVAAGSPYRVGTAGEVYPGFKRLSSILGDLGFTLVRRVFLTLGTKANPSVPVWSYEASYDHGTPVLGTFHGSDLNPVFFSGPQSWASQAVMRYYVNFIYDLDPNQGAGGCGARDDSGERFPYWPEWTEGEELLHINREGADLLADNFRNESYAWIADNLELLHF